MNQHCISCSGIGLEVHESPFLRGGSEDIILTGHTFSDEPGVYIEEQVSFIDAPPFQLVLKYLPGRGSFGRLLLYQ